MKLRINQMPSRTTSHQVLTTQHGIEPQKPPRTMQTSQTPTLSKNRLSGHSAMTVASLLLRPRNAVSRTKENKHLGGGYCSCYLLASPQAYAQYLQGTQHQGPRQTREGREQLRASQATGASGGLQQRLQEFCTTPLQSSQESPVRRKTLKHPLSAPISRYRTRYIFTFESQRETLIHAYQKGKYLLGISAQRC